MILILRSAEAKDTGVNQFPLLGRSRELQLYKKILSECLEVSKNRRTKTALGLEVLNHHNVLLIHGDARQGKTRLLDECIYITPSGIPLNRIALSNRDSKVGCSISNRDKFLYKMCFA